MLCEKCYNDHDGSYGSGRFCSENCARGFSTRIKRKEINAKVSQTLLGRVPACPFKKGYDWRRTVVDPEKRIASIRRFFASHIENTPFELLSESVQKRIVRKEQDGKCLWCGISEWRGLPLTLHVDHIDGNDENRRRENLRALCANCHGQTPTWGRKNRNK